MRYAALLLCGCLFACERPVQSSLVDLVVEASDTGVAVLSGGDTVFTLSASKWRGAASAAISITYDAPWGLHDDHHLATDAVIDRGMKMDMELVSWIFQQARHFPWIDYYKESLIPKGISFFGHGHTHALHDTMAYDEAHASFKTNFDHMSSWGLKPKAYAYPGSAGNKATTQIACERAGFICARGDSPSWEEAFIVPGEQMSPDNWFFLPSVIMGNASYRYVDTHEELLPALDGAVDLGAWLILTYHSIGIPEGWSFYPLDDFVSDLDAILERDVWNGNMDAVACYVKQRANLMFGIDSIDNQDDTQVISIRIDDALPDDIYDEPLTFALTAHDASIVLGGAAADDGGALMAQRGKTVHFDSVPTGAVYTFLVSR